MLSIILASVIMLFVIAPISILIGLILFCIIRLSVILLSVIMLKVKAPTNRWMLLLWLKGESQRNNCLQHEYHDSMTFLLRPWLLEISLCKVFHKNIVFFGMCSLPEWAGFEPLFLGLWVECSTPVLLVLDIQKLVVSLSWQSVIVVWNLTSILT
jgi:hypothetical protein